MRSENQKNIYIGAGIVALIAIIIIGLSVSGYHVSGFGIVKGGDLTVVLPEAAEGNATSTANKPVLFIDGKEVNGTTAKNLTPKTHEVIVAQENFWPWRKEVTIQSDETVTVTPFFVPSNTSGFTIANVDKDYPAINALFTKNTLPSEANPKVSADKTTSVWLAGQSIMTKEVSAATSSEAFSATEDIRSLDFYKDRNDVVIIAIGNGIYALELDNTGGQNFQPIYKGVAPSMIVKDAQTIYVKDGAVLLEVVL